MAVELNKLLQLVVDHGVAAVLDDHRLSAKTLNIRQRFRQDTGAVVGASNRIHKLKVPQKEKAA